MNETAHLNVIQISAYMNIKFKEIVCNDLDWLHIFALARQSLILNQQFSTLFSDLHAPPSLFVDFWSKMPKPCYLAFLIYFENDFWKNSSCK